MMEKSTKLIGVLGCGWLGLPLAKQLVDAGYVVRGTTTSKEKLAKIKSQGVTPFLSECTVNDCSSLAPFLLALDLLIIAIPPGIRQNPGKRFDLVMEEIIKEVNAQEVKKVVFISSTSVYGQASGEIDETLKAKPTSESGKQLLACEQKLLINPFFESCIIRFGGLIGPNRHPIFSLAKKGQISNAEGRINLIHLIDCIGLILACVTKFKGNITFNGVTPYHPSRKKYYTEMAALAILPTPVFLSKKAHDRVISSAKIQTALDYRFVVENLLILK